MPVVPAISIVLPSYNAHAFLEETLRAVLGQTTPDWELVVVDDGSKDDTLEIARRFERDPRVRVFSFPNGGEAVARTRGLAQVAGGSEYVLFLDHDDLLLPQCLEELRAALQRSPNAVGAYCSGRMIDAAGTPQSDDFLENWCRNRVELADGRFAALEPGCPTTFSTIAYGCCVLGGSCISSMSSCLLRRRCLPADGLFNVDMRTGSADIHLYLRLALQGDFLFVDEPLYLKRSHDTNITNNGRAVDASVLHALREVARIPRMGPHRRRTLSLAYRLRAKQKVKDYWALAKACWEAKRYRSILPNAARAGAYGLRYLRGV